MRQEEIMKENVFKGAEKIYSKDDINSQYMLVDQITNIMIKFENLMKIPETKTIIKVKLYELLATLINIDNG